MGKTRATHCPSGRCIFSASFGEPIDAAHLLQQQCPDWNERAAEIEDKPDWYLASLRRLGDEIMQGIGRACVVNPVNSVATILLATPRQSIEIEELIGQAELYERLIGNARCMASIRIEGKVDRSRVEDIAAQKVIHIRRHELGDVVYLKPENTVLLGYYRNNTLHTLVIPALIACCFTNVRRVSREGIERRIGLLYPFLKSELQLEWPVDALDPVVDEFIACMVRESLLEEVDDDLRRPRRSDHRFMQLIRMAQVVQPILERYYMTFIVLWQASSDPLDDAKLEHRCHLLAQKISMIYGINAPDFFDRLLFHDFIETMLEYEYLVRNDQQQLEFTPGFDYVSLDLRNLLSTEVRGSILSIIKTSPHRKPGGSRPRK